MTGNNLTYALIPRLSRRILSHRPSRSLAAIILFSPSNERLAREKPQVRSFVVIAYLHVGQLHRMTMHSLVVLAEDDPAVPLRIPTIAHVRALIRFPHGGPCAKSPRRISLLVSSARVVSLILSFSTWDKSDPPRFPDRAADFRKRAPPPVRADQRDRNADV